MATWERNENNKNIVYREIGIVGRYDENDNPIENSVRYYDAYFLTDRQGDFSKVCFVASDGIRFDFYNNVKREDGEDLEDYIQRVVEAHSEKVMSPEDLNFDKPLNAYVNFFNGPDKKAYISGLTKFGARIINVINDNPEIIDRVENKRLKKILIEESPVLLSREEDKGVVLKYKQKLFTYNFNKNKGDMLDGFTLTYENNKGKTVTRDYKMNIYYLNKAFLETKRLLKSPDKLVAVLRDKEANDYKKTVVEGYIHYNWEWNVINNKKFNKENLKNFKVYKVPTLSEMVQFYAEKRITQHYDSVLQSELDRLPADERKRRLTELVYSEDYLTKNVNRGALEFINKISGVDTFKKIEVEETQAPEHNTEIDDPDDVGVLQDDDVEIVSDNNSDKAEKPQQEDKPIIVDAKKETVIDTTATVVEDEEEVIPYPQGEVKKTDKAVKEPVKKEVKNEEKKPEKVENKKQQDVSKKKEKEVKATSKPSAKSELPYTVFYTYNGTDALFKSFATTNEAFAFEETVKNTNGIIDTWVRDDVQNIFLHKNPEKDIKKENVNKEKKENKAAKTESTKSEATSQGFLYNTLDFIEKGLDKVIETIKGYKDAILKGNNFDFQKVLNVIVKNVKLALNPPEEIIKTSTAYEEDSKKEKRSDITIEKLYEEFKKHSQMQDEKIAQLDKMISVLYNHVPVSELDEVKREMEEITSQSKTNNKDIDKNQEIR